MQPTDPLGAFAGLTALETPDEPLSFGDGVMLSRTFARFTTSFNFVNTGDTSVPGWRKSDPSKPLPLPPPSMWHLQAKKLDVTSQLFIPVNVAKSETEQLLVARLLTSALRLYADPAVTLVAISSCPYSALIDRRLEGCAIAPIEVAPRYFPLHNATNGCNHDGLKWVATHWKKMLDLYQSHAEFRLAVDALDHGQFEPNPSLSLVSLWGAIEALFSPSTTELKFRVSALVAAFLEPLGSTRLAKQREVSGLYDQRSAAAHGKPKHSSEHLLATFQLVRALLIRITESGRVPSKTELENNLFGVSNMSVNK
jgi:hypothetical protein